MILTEIYFLCWNPINKKFRKIECQNTHHNTCAFFIQTISTASRTQCGLQLWSSRTPKTRDYTINVSGRLSYVCTAYIHTGCIGIGTTTVFFFNQIYQMLGDSPMCFSKFHVVVFKKSILKYHRALVQSLFNNICRWDQQLE